MVRRQPFIDATTRRTIGFGPFAVGLVVLAAGCVASSGHALAQGGVDRPPFPGGPPVPPPFQGPPPPGFAPQALPTSPPLGQPIREGSGPVPSAPQAGQADAQDPSAPGSGVFGGAFSGAIYGAIGGVLLAIVFWALRLTARAAVKIDPATGGVVAEFSSGLRWLMLGFSMFTPGVLAIAMVARPPAGVGGLLVVGVFVLLFALLGGSVSWSLWRARVIATDSGLISESGWRRRRTLSWSDVREVAYVKSDAGLAFRGPGKQDVRVSILLAGLKPLADAMRQHLPAEKYQGAAEILARIDQLEGGSAIPMFGALGGKRAAARKA